MNINRTAAAFVELVQELILEKGYVLLNRREHEKAEQLGDKLLGYFDSKGVYFIPDRLFALAADFMSNHKTNVTDIETDLFVSDMIKIEDDGYKIRYRRQKRIGSTKKRYLTFERKVFEGNRRFAEIINCR